MNPTIERGDHREQPGHDHLALRGGGDQCDALAVLRLGRPLHDAGDLAELTAHLGDHAPGGPADGEHGERAEQERHDPAEQQPGDDGRIREIEAERQLVVRDQRLGEDVRVAREEHQRGEAR